MCVLIFLEDSPEQGKDVSCMLTMMNLPTHENGMFLPLCRCPLVYQHFEVSAYLFYTCFGDLCISISFLGEILYINFAFYTSIAAA